MLKEAYRAVEEFNRAFDIPTPVLPCIPPTEIAELRIALMYEELNEYVTALMNDDIVAVADALADLAYVVVGTAVAHGLTRFDEIFAEVHASNMSKLDDNGRPIRREDGKVMKGRGFVPPDLRSLVELT